ncbi:MAG: tyrosine-type recombinase/integrase [Dehalococcoidia bacterium]|jgi:integrase
MSDQDDRPRGRKQSNGAGSIVQRSDGRWMIRVTDPTSGKRRTAYAASRGEAVRKRRGMLAKAERRETVLDSAATLRSWVEDWTSSGRAARRRRESTVAAYDYRLKTYVLPIIGGLRLRDLTALDVDDLAHTLAGRGLSGATIKGALIALSACLDDAVRGRLLTANPGRGISVPDAAPRTAEVVPPTTEQVRDLLAALSGTDIEHLVALIVGTGCRIGEALAVRWSDLDLTGGSWSIRSTTTLTASGATVVGNRTKAGGVRRVALSPAVSGHLSAQAAHVECLRQRAKSAWTELDLVFPTSVGTPQHSANVRREFRAAAASVGFPGSFHALRHYVATAGLSALPPAVVAKQLGHRRASLTMDVYGHLLVDDSAVLAALVSGLVSNPDGDK